MISAVISRMLRHPTLSASVEPPNKIAVFRSDTSIKPPLSQSELNREAGQFSSHRGE